MQQGYYWNTDKAHIGDDAKGKTLCGRPLVGGEWADYELTDQYCRTCERIAVAEVIKEDCMEIPTQFEPSDNPYGEEDAVLYTAQRQELENLRKLVIASLDAAEPECHGPIQGFWIPAGYFDALSVAVQEAKRPQLP